MCHYLRRIYVLNVNVLSTEPLLKIFFPNLWFPLLFMPSFPHLGEETSRSYWYQQKCLKIFPLTRASRCFYPLSFANPCQPFSPSLTHDLFLSSFLWTELLNLPHLSHHFVSCSPLVVPLPLSFVPCSGVRALRLCLFKCSFVIFTSFLSFKTCNTAS